MFNMVNKPFCMAVSAANDLYVVFTKLSPKWHTRKVICHQLNALWSLTLSNLQPKCIRCNTEDFFSRASAYVLKGFMHCWLWMFRYQTGVYNRSVACTTCIIILLTSCSPLQFLSWCPASSQKRSVQIPDPRGGQPPDKHSFPAAGLYGRYTYTVKLVY